MRSGLRQLTIRSLLMSSAAVRNAVSAARPTDYYRADGVRITHDPYAPDMAEKYGKPGQTDSEGFDPYRDSVGPGIYGGVVKRDEEGQLIVGKQYQNHNPVPGPVYAGGGYTPICRALGDNSAVRALLQKYPDLVNDVSTGGAQPLHMCGMSQANQQSTRLLILCGADIEALDTYGMTPLHRMASNNLGVGAKMLLNAGADPEYRGTVGLSPLEMARGSAARDVIAVLQGAKRRVVHISKIVVAGAGEQTVNGEYVATEATTVPTGFDATCRSQGWSTGQLWNQLNGGATWFSAPNGAYVYFNRSDGHWWIDAPGGAGVYKAKAPPHAPPQVGWKTLSGVGPPPSLVAAMRVL